MTYNMCPLCTQKERLRSFSYCGDCNKMVTIRTQHRNKSACLAYRVPEGKCENCSCQLAQPITCFPVRKGLPKEGKLSRLFGRLPLSQTLKDSLDKRLALCLNCERKLYRGKRPVPLKVRSIEYLGGHCIKCNLGLSGFSNSAENLRESTQSLSSSAFDFHHKAGKGHSSKSFSIGSLWSTIHFELIRQELDKCELLCANCHALEHWADAWGKRQIYFNSIGVDMNEFFEGIGGYPLVELCSVEGKE